MAPRVARPEVALALLAGLAGLAGSYAVAGDAAAFVVTPVTAAVVTGTPAPIVTVTILVLQELGSTLALGVALALTIGLLAAVALAGFALARRLDRPIVAPGATLAGIWLAAVLLTGAPVRSLGAAVPAAAVVGGAIAATPGRPADIVSPSRRGLLAAVSAVVGFGALAAAVGSRGWLADDTGTDVDPAVERRIATAQATALDIEGLPPVVSPASEFYEVDISPVNPTVAAEEWTLSVIGDVEDALELDFDDVRSFPQENRFVTLRCVGDPLNGPQLDTALWSGVPFTAILDRASPRADQVILRGVDGYEVTFPLAALRPGLLAHRMNGHALPTKHGSPVRALVPGRWGETNVKWVTEIEVLADPEPGYWERRGWEGTGAVHTIAKLWAVNHLDGGRVQLGGYAYAGTRGVDRVEVSVDGGGTWAEATLSATLGTDVWRQWTYTYESPGEAHEAVVRAVDGTGAVQPQENQNPFPRGATGWVTETIDE